MEALLGTAAGFFELLLEQPLEALPALGFLIAVHVILKIVLKGYSRELWFRETKARARQVAGTLEQEEVEFLHQRSRRRWVYNGVPVALLVCLPFSFQWLTPLLAAYVPVIASLWLEILILVVVAMVVSHHDRMFELEQLAKQVQKARKGE